METILSRVRRASGGLAICWLAAPGPVAAQEAPGAAGRPTPAQLALPSHFTHLTQEDGLLQTTVDAIAQDSLGYLWLGTWDGLYRYDGRALRRFAPEPFDERALAYGSVRAFAPDGGRGGLWIGTDGGGIDHYAARTERFARATTAAEPTRRLAPGKVVDLLALGDGSGDFVYADDDRHVYRFRAATRTRFDYSRAPDGTVTAVGDFVWAFAAGPAGEVFVASDAGVLAFAPGGGLHAGHMGALGRALGALTVPAYALAVAEGRYLWIGRRGGFVGVDLATGRALAVPEAVRGLEALTLLPGRDGDLWIGARDGLVNYRHAEGGVRRYAHRELDRTSLLPGRVLALYLDRADVL